MSNDLKKLGLDQEPAWEIAAPGVLVLPGTKYEIRYHVSPVLGPWLTAYHDGARVAGCVTLETVKYGVKKHMQQLLELGLEP
jgi:hypothetical protein